MSAMKFWQIGPPDYKSDYQDSYINGSLEHPIKFPSVDCDVCMTTWGWSGLRSIPYECPESLRNEMSTAPHHSLPRTEHLVLQRRLLDELRTQGQPFVDIRPGYRFPPGYLDVPSRPRADFLWPFGGLLVSERIRDVFVEVCGDHLAVFPVILRKVGKREAKLPAPIPQTGEPEDIINELPLLSDTTDVGPYYEIVPRSASDESPDRIESSCSACGSVTRTVVYPIGGRPLRMAEDTWKGHTIFYLSETLHIVVTDEVKRALQSAQPSNLQLTEVWCMTG